MQDRENPRPEDLAKAGRPLAGKPADRGHFEVPIPFSETTLRSVLENVPAIIAQFDLKGNLAFVNRTVAGMTTDEVLGRHISELVPPQSRAELMSGIEKVIESREPVTFEFPGIGPLGTTSSYSGRLGPVLEDGRVVGLMSVVTDITDRRRAESQARQSRRLLDELAHLGRISTMGEMATGLAHELNQPLTAIVAYVDACQELVESGRMDNVQLAEVLRAVSGQAERAGQIIHRLRSMIKRSQPIRSPMSVNDAIREVAVLFEAEARQAGVTVRLELGEDLLETAADFLQVQQVVLNLMRNGLEAMTDVAEHQRQLTIATGRLPVGDTEIAVADSGHGLVGDSAEQAFEPFFTTKANGLGLGLSISRTIVEAHGGRIWITPNSTQGVTARFTLPSRGEKAAHASETNRLHR